MLTILSDLFPHHTYTALRLYLYSPVIEPFDVAFKGSVSKESGGGGKRRGDTFFALHSVQDVLHTWM